MSSSQRRPKTGYDARTQNSIDIFDIERELRAEPPTARYAREGPA